MSNRAGNLFKICNLIYLYVFIGGRVLFEITSTLNIITFNSFNLIWYLLSFLLFTSFIYYENFFTRSRLILITILSMLFFVAISYVSIAYVFNVSASVGKEFKTMYLGYVLSLFSYFCVGLSLFYVAFFLDYKYILTILILACFPILLIADYSTFSIPFKEIFTDGGVNYLLFGDLISLLFFVFCFSFLKNKNRAKVSVNIILFVYFLTVLLVLYINGSRTSFAVFMFSFLITYLFCMFRLRPSSIYFCIFLLSLSLLSFYILHGMDFNFSRFSDSRMLSILSTRSEDGSLVARRLINYYGIQRIENNFFQGDIGGQVMHPYGGSPLGSYMHNFLSYMAQFGLPAFFFFIISWILLAVNIALSLRRSSFAVYSVFLFAIISLIFSRAFVHTIFFAYWSFCLYSAYYFRKIRLEVVDE